MKKKTVKMLFTAVSAMMITAAASGMVSAETLANMCGGEELAMVNVETELLVRGAASKSGEIVGYLASGSGVLVKGGNSDWTKITSGDVSGFVKSEYLADAEKSEALKEENGVDGAVAKTDGVNVYKDMDASSEVLGTINKGEGFVATGSSEEWVEVLLENEDRAYVAVADVELTKVVKTALTVEQYEEAGKGEEEENYEEENNDTSSTESYVPETEAYYPPQTDAYYPPETEYYPPETDYVPEEPATDAPATEEPADVPDETATEPVYEDQTLDPSDPENGVWDADTTEANDDDVVISDDLASAAPEDEAAAVEAADDGEEDTYDYENTQDGQEPTGDDTLDLEGDGADTSDGADLNSDDVDLLAALIYCEAGNQSEEGKVAVGQVVMNRVESESFADSIHDVIYESGQFTPASSGWLEEVIGNVPDDCYNAAVAAMNGEGTVGDALYFNTGSGQGVQIGDHQFY